MKLYLTLLGLLAFTGIFAQYPTGCGAISARNNSNGQATSCAGVSGTTIAANFSGTSYNTVPAGAKTADVTFKYLNVDYTTLTPYAITEISHTVGGITTILNAPAGPAGVPTLTGSNDALVKYCVYVTNIPTSGTLNFKLTNPETGSAYGTCFYDASCNSNCISTGMLLPVENLVLKAKRAGSVILLDWSTTNETHTQSFEIEKAADGQHFSSIGIKSAAGYGGADYSFSDPQPLINKNYYRIKIINSNGTFHYSDIVQVKEKTPINKYTVQPNPFINELLLEATLERVEMVNIQLLDIRGKEILSRRQAGTAGANLVRISGLSYIQGGIYLIKVTVGNDTWQQKLIK